jgi:hypothetical protein
MDTYTQLLAAYNRNLSPYIRPVTAPQGATRAWVATSRRGWRQLTEKAEGGGKLLPAILEADGAIWLIEAVGKLLASDAFYTTTTEAKTIGRKKYIKLNARLIDAIVGQSLYFCDGFFRVTSTATTGDTIDIGLFLRELDGRPTTLEALITDKDARDAARRAAQE